MHQPISKSLLAVHHPGPYWRRAVSFLLLFLLIPPLTAASITWDGGAGDSSWNSPANWSGNVLPGAADDVTINVPGPLTVSIPSGTISIRSLQCANGLQISGGDLSLTAGTSVVSGSLQFTAGRLAVRGAGAVLTASGATTYETSVLAAGAGGQLRLPNLPRLVRANTGVILVTADGAGSVVDLSGVTNASVLANYRLELDATVGGEIRLPLLATMTGALSAYADGSNSVVSLPGFVGRLANTLPGNASLQARNGGRILIPNVTAIDRFSVYLAGSSQIPLSQISSFSYGDLTLVGCTNDWPGWTNLAGSDVLLSSGAKLTLSGITQLGKTNIGLLTYSARDPGSVLHLPNVSSATMLDYYQLALTTYNGGQLFLPLLSVLNGAVNAYTDGAGSLVDLPGLTGVFRNATPGAAYLEARNGGAIQIPNVRVLDRVSLILRNGGQIPLAQITEFKGAELTLDATSRNLPGITNTLGSDLTVENGGVLVLSGITQLVKTNNGSLILTASGPGSRLSLPNVTTGAILDYYQLSPQSYSGGQILLPRLISLNGAINAYADGLGSVVDLPGLTGTFRNATPGAAYIEARAGGAVQIPNVTALDRIVVTLRGASDIPFSQITAFTGGKLTLDGSILSLPGLVDVRGSDLEADNAAQLTLGGITQLVKTNAGGLVLTADAGATLDLPNVTTATTLDFYLLTVQATGGGHLLLPRLSILNCAINAYAEGAGSVVDLSGLQGAQTSSASGEGYFEVRSGGTVLIPHVTSLDRINLTIRGTGQIATAQLTAITRSTVTIDGTTVAFGGLADTTGSTFDYLNGGAAFFLPPADLSVTAIQTHATALANQPVDVVWEITNTGTGITNAIWSDALSLSADAAAGQDTLIGLVQVGGTLGAGASRRFTNSVLFPARYSGTWRLVVAANQSRSVWEGNNTLNNTNIAATPIQILAPDLVIDTMSALPATAQYGQSVNVSWTVRNAGTAPALSSWRDSVFLSRVSTSVSGGILLFSTNSAQTLDPGQSRVYSASVALPLLSGWTNGSYHLIAFTDIGNAVAEGVETNNLRSASVSLSLPPLPDLTPVRLQSPASALPGENVQFVWTATNSGPALATGTWVETINVTRTNVGATPQTLLLLTTTNALVAGGSITRTQQVLLPDNLAAGNYQARVDLDADQTLLESNDANNSLVAPSLLTVPAVLRLQLPLTEISEGANPPFFVAIVSRNGDLTSPLVVSLASSLTNELSLSPTVTIAAGAASAQFNVVVQHDNVPDLDRLVTLTATAAGYQPGTGAVTVRNIDIPHLGLQVTASNLTEGQTVDATVSRDGPTAAGVTVKLTTPAIGHLLAPDDVTIPAGQTSATFSVTAVDNTQIESPASATLEASAPGYSGAATVLTIADNDLPELTLSLTANTVSEGAGPAATTAIVSRRQSSPRSLIVEIETSDPGTVVVPSQVIIPAGQADVSVPIGAVNNSVVDSPRTVTLRAFALASVSGVRVAQSAPATLTVNDDDSPVLKVTIDRDVLAEGLATAATLTVARNASTNQALVVTLVSSDVTEATVPVTLTIPAGRTNATAPVKTLDDQIDDGSQPVILTASATGYAPDSTRIIVTDVNRPDLVVSEVGGPDTAETEAFINVNYRVFNQGLAPAGTNWATRLLLSRDASYGDDTLLADYVFNGTLPVGQFFGQSRQVRLPLEPGDYWIIATTDIAAQIDEIREDNNFSVSARPIHVMPAYSAVVEADIGTAPAGTVVPLHGTASRTQTGGPAPFVLVNIHLRVRGTERLFSALTDDQGRFTASFTPLPGEAGLYEIGATHPGVSNAPIQDSFTLIGMKAGKIDPLKLADGTTLTGQVPVQNLGDLPLTGMTVTVASNSPNLQVTATLAGGGTLPGLATAPLGFAIAATDASVPEGTVVLRVASTEGASLDVTLPVSVVTLTPRLVTRPDELIAGMKRGGQAFVQFDVVNEGGAASGPIQIVLPEFPWMHVVTANPLPSLESGATNRILLQLTPPADLPLGPYTGTIALNTASASTSVPYQFRSLSEARGDLRITAVDEYTYYAEGAPKVAGAVVTVRDAVTEQVITNGVTDAAGQFLVSQVPEGYYEVRVSADRHHDYRDLNLVVAGFETPLTAFLSREAVHYIWTVTPTEIQDRTRITIETVFEAFVPIPVITIDPPLIDLADYTADVTQIDLKITNHGLIAAKEAALSFGSHPDWEFEPLITDLGDLPARSSLTIPLLIRKLNGPGAALRRAGVLAKQGGGGGCSVSGSCRFIVECGGAKIGGGAPVIIVNASGNCGGGGGGGITGGPGGGNTGGGGGGGGSPNSSASIRSCDSCMPKVLDCIIDFTIPDWADCLKDGGGCINSGGLWDCTKAALTCAEFGGKEALGPVNKAIDVAECLQGLQEGCQSIPSGGGGGGASGSRLLSRSGLGKLGPDQVSRIERGEYTFVRQRAEAVLRKVAPTRYLFGNDAWFGPPVPVEVTNWIHGFLQRIEPTTGDGIKISPNEAAELGLIPLPATVTPAVAQAFVARWNRSVDYWNRGIINQTDLPIGENPDFLAADVLNDLNRDAEDAEVSARAAGYASSFDALYQARGEFMKFMSEGDAGGVCAHVRIRLDQELVSTRDAFTAGLEIENAQSEPLEQMFVELTVRRRSGEDASALFAVMPPVLTGLSAVDGTGVITPNSTGVAKWLLVPTTDAAVNGPEEFLVSGVLRYRQGTLNLNVPLAPAVITVLPSPSLAVKYFHQRDVFGDDPFTVEVEPSIPFSLAVMVQNKGHGAARNVRISSAQPRIVENEKGLLVDFKIIATEVAGQNLQPSLNVEFGQIDPGANAIGRWLLTSTLLGGFIEYSASIEHLDGVGTKKLSLVEGVEIHELIHIVHALGARDDGRPDFLVNDVVDLYDRPDTIHLSDGSVEPVSLVPSGSVDGVPTAGDLQVVLTAKFPTGWAYLRMPDPGTNRFRLARVVRSDGREIPVGDNAWTTDRTFLGNARRPLKESMLHLLDDNSTGQYTLYYANLPPQDETPPVSLVEALPLESSARIPVAWNGQDNTGGTGISFYDVYVSIDNGPFLLWQKETLDRSGVYQGALGRSYAFYSVATDLAGNREEPPAIPDARTTVTRINRAPTLDPIADRLLREGETLSVRAIATDPDGDSLVFSLGTNAPAGVVIQPYTGQITWVTGEGSGPSSNRLTVTALDTGSPRLGAVRSFTVTVTDDNSPPVLSPIPNQTIGEGRSLILTNRAQDFDLPLQTLTFALGPGAPAGASLDPVTGVFAWTPSNIQGGTTNRVAVIVGDSGLPSLTATQSFTIIVRDTRNDFFVGFNSTNLLAGQSSTVPLLLDSSADLTRVTFEFEAADPHLAALALLPTSAEIVSAAFEPLGNSLYRVQLDLDPTHGQSGLRTLATLEFDSLIAGRSSVARLDLARINAVLLDGSTLTNALAGRGRLFLIEDEPLLDAQTLPAGLLRLTIYAEPNSNVRLQYTPEISGQNTQWMDVQALQMPGTFRVFDRAINASPTGYFRVVRD